MAPSSSKRSTKIATRSQSRGLGAAARKSAGKVPAKTVTKTATKPATKSAKVHRWGAVLAAKPAQGKADALRYTVWASFAAGSDSAFGYGAYFADSEPR